MDKVYQKVFASAILVCVLVIISFYIQYPSEHGEPSLNDQLPFLEYLKYGILALIVLTVAVPVYRFYKMFR